MLLPPRLPPGWWDGNSKSKTHPVGQKKPNALGLYDMHGDVGQWCSDYFGGYPAGDAVDPGGPPVGDKDGSRVQRGGSWFNGPAFCRAAFRDRNAPSTRDVRLGLRVCLDF